jgi:hemin uptake protein HemP
MRPDTTHTKPGPLGWPKPTRPHAEDGAGTTASKPPLFDSDSLMQGQREILITHQGLTYRLQTTRLGKLILTK